MLPFPSPFCQLVLRFAKRLFRFRNLLRSILDHGGQARSQKRSRPTEREVNTAVYLLRAKQMGLTLSELDELDEGTVMDMIIEAGNDLCEDEYCQVADQHAMDIF